MKIEVQRPENKKALLLAKILADSVNSKKKRNCLQLVYSNDEA